MKVGVVVRTRNRHQNLEWLLESLSAQSFHDFTAVVADDGSTDGTQDMVERRARDRLWNGRLRWISCGPLGGRPGRAHNIGMANLPAGTSLAVMLDSDLILQPTAMERFETLHAQYPDLILLGQLDRLPPVEGEDISTYLAAGDLTGLRERVPQRYSMSVPRESDSWEPEVGPDYRSAISHGEPGRPVLLTPYGSVVNNAGWPLSIVWALGGLDERMSGWGHNDLEFGTRAASSGVRSIFLEELWALHVWHPQPRRAGCEWQYNLDYYIRRHRNYDMEMLSDWSLWFHYHVERGGSIVRCHDTLWALNRSKTDRISLPDPGWLGKLGNCGHQIPIVSPAEIASATDHGRAEQVLKLVEPTGHSSSHSDGRW